MQRIVSQTAYRKMVKAREQARGSLCAARTSGLAVLARPVVTADDRERAIYAYIKARFEYRHYSWHVANATPAEKKQPFWSPAARERNGMA